jgi:hypothetical protein
MNKHEFMAVMERTGELYGKPLKGAQIALYWEALRHETLEDIKTAINLHARDPENGRFLPLPAHILAQLPRRDLWPTADEAWAMCPKDESESASMFDEMAQAFGIAEDLINAGDMIAARRAFIDHYNRLIEQAKWDGRNPVWWPSLGSDKDGRELAQRKTVEMNNLALPIDERKSLPNPIPQETTIDKLTQSAPETARKHLADLKKILGK